MAAFRELVVSLWMPASPLSSAVMLKQVTLVGGAGGGLGTTMTGAGWGQVGSLAGFFSTVQQVWKEAAVGRERKMGGRLGKRAAV